MESREPQILYKQAGFNSLQLLAAATIQCCSLVFFMKNVVPCFFLMKNVVPWCWCSAAVAAAAAGHCFLVLVQCSCSRSCSRQTRPTNHSYAQKEREIRPEPGPPEAKMSNSQYMNNNLYFLSTK
jgi:hypothetical protein